MASVFDGASETEIKSMLSIADLPETVKRSDRW